MKIRIQCDRCGVLVAGIILDAVPEKDIPRCTGGFYEVSDGYWKKFGRWQEKNICDECMMSDPLYKEEYNQ